MMVSAINIFCSQEQGFTAKTLMKQEKSLKNQTITFEGKRYKVTEDEVHAPDKNYGNCLSRWITLKRNSSYLETHEINLSAPGNTSVGSSYDVNYDDTQVGYRLGWSMHGDMVSPRYRTYRSPFARALRVTAVVLGATAAGAGIVCLYKSKSSK